MNIFVSCVNVHQRVVLPGLGSRSFQLTLLRGPDNTKRHRRGSLVFQTFSSLPPSWSNRPTFLWESRSVTPASKAAPFFALIWSHEEPTVAR